MKKLILSGMILFAYFAVAAQNRAVLGQVGTQPNASWANETQITQLSNNNSAPVWQIDMSASKATIGQQLMANANVAIIEQYASSNTALIQQTNQSSGLARISQNGQTPFGSGNVAVVYQGNNAYGPSSDNVTFVMQENANNVSRSEQLGVNNVAIINQHGNGNSLSFGLSGTNNRVLLSQDGGDRLQLQGLQQNNAHLEISQGSGNNTLTIDNASMSRNAHGTGIPNLRIEQSGGATAIIQNGLLIGN